MSSRQALGNLALLRSSAAGHPRRHRIGDAAADGFPATCRVPSREVRFDGSAPLPPRGRVGRPAQPVRRGDKVTPSNTRVFITCPPNASIDIRAARVRTGVRDDSNTGGTSLAHLAHVEERPDVVHTIATRPAAGEDLERGDGRQRVARQGAFSKMDVTSRPPSRHGGPAEAAGRLRRSRRS